MIFKKRPEPFAPPLILTPELLAEIRRLLAREKKIPAIKLLRERTGLGLKDAKDLAEAIERGYEPPLQGRMPLSERVRALRDAGDHASAVAMVQAETGMQRHEAERFVSVLD
ncbi:ribosomal protein L7/L12 [Actinocorallia aurantiaca]|uniref:Large ribosomal subunit protein bL12 C-terminal domain-containing protein n=1 Tax=Actinocorallia aurantiaca TaxID=46204 RepID=A0ABN3U0T5_9ACTN